MIPFLKQVAARYGATDIQHTCFIFPNRRSTVFFRKYLGEFLRESGQTRPMLAPETLTINDFFYRACDVDVTDRVRLLVGLYEVWKELDPKAEPLDEFVFWGEIILSDFDDVDKYLVDARELFANVADFKDIQDDFSHLSDLQRAAIERFVAHFRDRRGRLTVHMDAESSDVKARFLQVWNRLAPLYERYRKRLEGKGMAYEGMVYRSLAQRLRDGTSAADLLQAAFPEARQYVFIGLNALNECEKTLLRKMRDAGLAAFCWDYSSPMVRHPLNKSSFFMKDNVAEFPQAFPLDPDGLTRPDFQVISVPSSVGQAKLAPQILREAVPCDPVETAFVLPDENLLMPLLNSIPPEVDRINVTMGYPMTGGAVYTLMGSIAALQLRLRSHGGTWHFYHRPVHAIFSSSVFRKVLTPEEEAVVARVKAGARYYIPESDLRGGPLLDRIFRAVILQPKEVLPEQNHALEDYFKDIISYVGWRLRDREDMLLELDFAKQYAMKLNVLRDIDIAVQPATYLRLLDQLVASQAVPFEGEPLQGLQIMGPLETRALDFRNLVILSANEGTFPRRSVSSSFIPPELRKGFGLPTYEYQDAVWAYYFYRMVQRAEKVWLVCDSRTEGLKSGEESRYIKQLQYHFRVPLTRRTASAPMHATAGEDEIPKTAEDIAAIRNGHLSATALQSWLYCQAKFYYQVVKGLKEEEEVAESLDAGMLGNVFHATMQELYDGRERVTVADLDTFLKDRGALKAVVRKHILEQMHSIEVAGRNLVIEEVILEYVVKTLRHDRKLLVEAGSEGFRILGLERFMECDFEGFHFLGFVDRMDSYRDGEVRIVDYKTGKVEDEDIDITDDNAAAVVDKLFGPSNTGRPKIALQLFLYDLFAREDPQLAGAQIVNSIYSAARLFTDPLEDRPQSAEFARLVRERLKETLAGMVDPAMPFRRTDDLHTCSYCDFKMICGR